MGSSHSPAFAAGSLAVLIASAAAAPAFAAGTTRIRQSDGTTRTYVHTSIVASEPTDARISSPDGKDALLVRSTCSPATGVEHCRPTSVVLVRSGRRYPLSLRSADEYYNESDSPKPVAARSPSVPAHGLALRIVTAKDTTIDVRGTVDGRAHA